jgi:hypothetical protein
MQRGLSGGVATFVPLYDLNVDPLARAGRRCHVMAVVNVDIARLPPRVIHLDHHQGGQRGSLPVWVTGDPR